MQCRMATLRGADPSFSTILPPGWTRGVVHPLKLDTGKDIIIITIAVLRHNRWVEGIKTGSNNDTTDIYFFYCLFLLEVNGFSFAELLTGTTFTFKEINTAFPVNNRYVWYCLRKRCVNYLSLAHADIELVIRLYGAFVLTGTASGALSYIYIAWFSSYSDLKVTHVA